MKSEWKEFVLGQSCTKIGSGATPTGGKETYLSEGEIALIRSQNVLDFEFSLDGLAYINQDQAKKLNNVELVKDDVLINITGDSVARVCKVPDDLLPARVNQHVAILRTHKDKLDSEFLKYSLLLPSNKSLLLAIASAGATRNALTKVMLETFTIRAPKDVATQSKVANVLKQLDLKIAINKKINQTLETIAQTLFKSWFVDFDPVKAKIAAKEQGQDPQLAAMMAISGKTAEQIAQLPTDKRNELAATADLFPDEMVESELGMIPRGWKVGKIGDIYTSKGGYAFKSDEFMDEGYPVVKIKNITNSGYIDLNDTQKIALESTQNKDSFLLRSGDVIMAMTGATIGKVGIIANHTNKNCYLNQRVAKFASNSKLENLSWFVYIFFRREENTAAIISMAQGSAQPNISTTGIDSIDIVIPSNKLVNRFNSIVDPLFKAWINNSIQNNKLSDTRDILLPELLSGKLSRIE